MNLVQRIVNAIHRFVRAPRPGVLLSPRKADLQRDYPADGLTPQRLVALFRQADAGDLQAQMALFEQMEEKDAHLFSVANTRRLAVTGLPWEIVSAAELPGWRADARTAGEKSLADAAAQYCDETLRDLPGFEEALAHLSLAVGRNIALVELVWQADRGGVRLAEVVPVEFNRLTLGEMGEIRLLTDESRHEGIALPPGKFIVHTPHVPMAHAPFAGAAGRGAGGRGTHPERGGLLRVSALAYLGKHFAIKDWLIFAEVFGMPVRIARYSPSATPEEKRELLDMLRQLGADATGIFSKAVELEIIQSRSPGETNLYENLCLYFDREISKAWLGQTLTTDTARMLASAGAAKVHDQVRRDLLAPLVRWRIGPAAPVPHFRRVIDARFEPEKLGRVLDILVNRLGGRVPARWVHAALGIPQAGAGEAVLAARMGNGESRRG